MGVRRHRRYSTEFKLQLVEAYLAGDGSAKGLADEHGICHSLILIWAEKYRKGELTLDVQPQLPRDRRLREPRLQIVLEQHEGIPSVHGPAPPTRSRQAPNEGAPTSGPTPTTQVCTFTRRFCAICSRR